jgi:hypothetical protein
MGKVRSERMKSHHQESKASVEMHIVGVIPAGRGWWWSAGEGRESRHQIFVAFEVEESPDIGWVPVALADLVIDHGAGFADGVIGRRLWDHRERLVELWGSDARNRGGIWGEKRRMGRGQRRELLDSCGGSEAREEGGGEGTRRVLVWLILAIDPQTASVHEEVELVEELGPVEGDRRWGGRADGGRE